jgi:hypothetical protein
MARWATLCEIAGVSFTGCRAEIVDPEGFNSVYAGSIDWGNKGGTNVQVVNRGVKGVLFGIKMESAESTQLANTLFAISSALSGGNAFRVQHTEGLYTLDLDCEPDYTQGDKWFSHGKQSEGWYENVLFRFATVGQHA